MEKTEELQNKIKLVEREIANLSANLQQLKQELKNEPQNQFKRVERGHIYYTIAVDSGIFCPYREREVKSYQNESCFDNNNYFLTKERANAAINKIDYLLELERLYDMYCPDYVPDWNDLNKLKYYIVFDNKNNRFCYNYQYSAPTHSTVYFPSSEIAKKVADILTKNYGLRPKK